MIFYQHTEEMQHCKEKTIHFIATTLLYSKAAHFSKLHFQVIVINFYGEAAERNQLQTRQHCLSLKYIFLQLTLLKLAAPHSWSWTVRL